MAESPRRIPTFDEIIAHKADEVRILSARVNRFKEIFEDRNQIAVIAQLNNSSPEQGKLHDQNLVKLAVEFENAGATALAVLTDEKYFGGNRLLLAQICTETNIPVIQKDLILSPAQIDTQADAVVIVVKSLNKQNVSLKPLLDVCRYELFVAPIIEVNDREELEYALSSGADIIAVNSRNLSDYSKDMKKARDLIRQIQSGRIIKFFFSNIESRKDIQKAAEAGAQAVLVWTALAKVPDPIAKLQELTGKI